VSAGRTLDFEVVVIGGGVVGCAVAYTLARRGVTICLLEAEPELALGASGTNSGILHTGFDSKPGDLETRLILRSVALRDAALEELSTPVLRCGAVLKPHDTTEAETVRRTVENAARNGVETTLGADGTLRISGEWVTDPVAYTKALASAAAAGGASVRIGTRVEAVEPAFQRTQLKLASGETLTCACTVNAAGLRADEIAETAGDRSFEIFPRKGEFFVFDPPGGATLECIMLPVPTKRTKGVLVFPSIDGKVIVGPTAIDGSDKDDWSVRGVAREEIMEKVLRVYPLLEGAEPIASYAGLRPAGRDANYVIGPSAANPALINVAAIRSTGISASLGIGAFVGELVAQHGIALGPERELTASPPDPDREPWWKRASRRMEAAA
jgi:glycerol-3-phosphate dehydrogenase